LYVIVMFCPAVSDQPSVTAHVICSAWPTVATCTSPASAIASPFTVVLDSTYLNPRGNLSTIELIISVSVSALFTVIVYVSRFCGEVLATHCLEDVFPTVKLEVVVFPL